MFKLLHLKLRRNLDITLKLRIQVRKNLFIIENGVVVYMPVNALHLLLFQ